MKLYQGNAKELEEKRLIVTTEDLVIIQWKLSKMNMVCS